MKAFVRVTTPRGVFVGRTFESNNEELEVLEKILSQAASGDTKHFTLKTESGGLVFASETLKNSVFEIVTKEA